MTRLINDLLDISRISRGKIMLQTQICDLRDVITGAIEAVSPFIASSDHTLHVHSGIGSEALLVAGDSARLVQVVVNLLNNSAKYTPAKGDIWLSAVRQGDHVMIQVRDNGIGLAEDQLTQVFEMFEQVDVSKERGQAGLGIGLSLVKSLIESHRGSVTAASDGPGRGSVFSIRLPLLASDDRELPLVDSPAIDAAPVRPLRILVIEDTKPIRFMMVMNGYQFARQVRQIE